MHLVNSCAHSLFLESVTDQPATVALTLQFSSSSSSSSSSSPCVDLATVGLSLSSLRDERSCTFSLNTAHSFTLLHHTPAARTDSEGLGSFVSLSVSEERAPPRGLGRLVCGSGASVSSSDSSLALAALVAGSSAPVTALRAPLYSRSGGSSSSSGKVEQLQSSPLGCGESGGGVGVLRLVVVEPSSLGLNLPTDSSVLVQLHRLSPSSSYPRLEIKLFTAEAGAGDRPSLHAISQSPKHHRDSEERSPRTPLLEQGVPTPLQAPQYSVEIVPHRHYGLGLRLGARDGAVSVGECSPSFSSP